jgi:hypothetical protein
MNDKPVELRNSKLRAVKTVHTAIWAFFAACIGAIYVGVWMGRPGLALVFAGIVAIEVLILLLNKLRCPLTAVAAKYSDSREANFDIYLPRWLARHNKLIFGTLYVAGVAMAVASWLIAGN